MPIGAAAPRPAQQRQPGVTRSIVRWVAVCAFAPVVTGCPQLLSGDFETVGRIDDGISASGGEAGDDSGGAPNTLPPSTTATGSGGSGSTTGSAAGGSNSAGGSDGGSDSGGSSNGGAGSVAGSAGSSPAGSTSGGSGGAGAGGTIGTPDGGAIGGAGGAPGSTCVAETEYCDGRDNDCDGDVDEDGCDDGCVGFTFDGHGYMSCNTLLNADGARAACEDNDMYLVEIESQEENDAVLAFAPVVEGWSASTYFGPLPGAYIGATASSDLDQWHWDESGTVFYEGGATVPGVYSNWGSGQPNNTSGDQTCAGVWVEDGAAGNAGEWNDADCRAELAYVCETD